MTEDKKPAEAADPEAEIDEAAAAAPDGPGASAADPSDDPLAAAEARIQQLEADISDLRDRSLRALADAENTRRRSERELADARKYASSNFAKDLLNVSDNLGRALESVPEELRERDENFKTLIVGVEMVEKDLLTAFERQGITKIEPLGEKFDHTYHQAMFEVPDSGEPAGTIVQLLQPGYVMHDRLLRPAMVGVAKGQSESPPDDAGHVDTTA